MSTNNNNNEKKVVLKVENLRTSFYPQGRIAADGVSFTIHEGETLGVENPAAAKQLQGCLLPRLPEPAGKIIGGEIILDGRNLLELRKRKCAMSGEG